MSSDSWCWVNVHALVLIAVDLDLFSLLIPFKRVKMYRTLRVRSPPRVQWADPLALRIWVSAATTVKCLATSRANDSCAISTDSSKAFVTGRVCRLLWSVKIPDVCLIIHKEGRIVWNPGSLHRNDRGFRGLPSPSSHIPEYYLKLGHDHIPPHPLQLIY
jgi:hypothetical protein